MKYFGTCFRLVFIFTAVVILAVQIGKAASPLDSPTFSIPLIINENNLRSYGLNFGIHPSATKGIDLSLGEKEYPPFPPGGGMSMFRTVDGNSILDLRPYVSPTQADTYLICIALDESDYVLFPMTFSWPNLSSYYSGSVRLISNIEDISIDIDMKARTSYSRISYPGYPEMKIWYLYIIAAGPLPGTSLPVVSTYGLANGGFQGIVHAPVGEATSTNSAFSVTAGTTTWFEYGPNKLYGTLTTPQVVADGTSMNVSAPFDPRTLPPDTRIHFRAVAQTNSGTFYGEDQIISNGTPPPEDTSGFVKYRTATYRDWADSKDQKDKRKAIKYKPDKVDFCFYVVTDSPGTWGINITFSVPIHLDSMITVPPNGGSGVDVTGKKWGCGWTRPGLAAGETVYVYGIGLKGKEQSVSSYKWVIYDPQNDILIFKKKKDAIFVQNDLKLPMPNLHNVGESIYGGVMQTPVNIIVGITDDPKGAHTVYHPKYKDVLKSFVKEKRGGDLYHTRQWHCLDEFDKNHHDISRAQKSLPPDKHNNLMFAEQLTLKLNIAASDSGIFPKGLGELIYSNGTPFDDETVRMITVYVDSFLACPPLPPKGVADSSVYIKILQDINGAFSGAMDTTSWSGDKVVCTGVKMLMEVPYLRANPNPVPLVFAPRPQYPMNLGPDAYALHQNYPNPFNPTTTIEFELGSDAIVTVKVFNTLGQEVVTLAEKEEFNAGQNELEFDGAGLASGIYYYRITAEDIKGNGIVYNNVRKMLLIK